MDQDLDSLEEKFKKKEKSQKGQKGSGRSVFKLHEIIKNIDLIKNNINDNLITK